MAKQDQSENFDPDKIAAFRKMVNGCVEYASMNNVPLCVTEAAFRDVLAGVDSYRLLQGLRRTGGRI